MHNLTKPIKLTILGLAITLTGCSTANEPITPEQTPFVFNTLNLSHNKPNGTKDWDLSSPEARYDSMKRTIVANSPEILIYKLNLPSISIKSEKATIINDGDSIILEGNVIFNKINEPTYTFKTNDLSWDIKDGPIVSKSSIVGYSSISNNKIQQTLQGDGVTGNSKKYVIEISNCKIEQTDEVLTSRACRWNWDLNNIEALGNVIYKRSNPHQITQSERMIIDLNKNGTILFSSPSSRVYTRIIIPRDN